MDKQQLKIRPPFISILIMEWIRNEANVLRRVIVTNDTPAPIIKHVRDLPLRSIPGPYENYVLYVDGRSFIDDAVDGEILPPMSEFDKNKLISAALTKMLASITDTACRPRYEDFMFRLGYELTLRHPSTPGRWNILHQNQSSTPLAINCFVQTLLLKSPTKYSSAREVFIPDRLWTNIVNSYQHTKVNVQINEAVDHWIKDKHGVATIYDDFANLIIKGSSSCFIPSKSDFAITAKNQIGVSPAGIIKGPTRGHIQSRPLFRSINLTRAQIEMAEERYNRERGILPTTNSGPKYYDVNNSAWRMGNAKQQADEQKKEDSIIPQDLVDKVTTAQNIMQALGFVSELAEFLTI